MKRMTVIAALTTALLVGMTPCAAQETPVATATVAPGTSASTVAVSATVSATAVADAVPTSPTTTADSSTTAAHSDSADNGDDQDYWPDLEAQRGETIRVNFEGDRTFDDLQVEVSAPFQSFRTTVLSDQSIVVSVPQNFSAAAKVAPVFTVLDGDEPVDTFTVSVEYSRPKMDPVENSSPLFSLISNIAFRLPQLPFMAFLFEE
ncbi:hypothetical protein CFAEC_10005 [Corynebacterium faecale]|uniref:hypothetical protein n=1 Tax=Corynebacterium faecale TaxID=1758466 RepID=UPI0025B42529|nr:hypothetical protein [Corynebacterium faecale]WJY92814.1 hypothetical protein CFAEC_10005 [Corynebacterium faecale]